MLLFYPLKCSCPFYRVPQEIVQWELKNRTTRTYKWCISVPPRCSVYSNSVVNETKVTVMNVTKLVELCCEGYIEQGHFCISLCQDCQNGLCLGGTCVCQSGWIGPQCDTRAGNNESTSTSRSTNLKTTILEMYKISNMYMPATTPLEGRRFSPTSKSYTAEKDENIVSSARSTITVDHRTSKFTYNDSGAGSIGHLNYRSNFLQTESTSSAVSASAENNVDSTRNSTIWDVSRNSIFDISSITTPSFLPKNQKNLGSKYWSKPNNFVQSSSTTGTSYFDTTVTEPISSIEEKLLKNTDLISPTIETAESSLDYRETDRDAFGGPSDEKTSKIMENWNSVEQIDSKLITTLMPQTVLAKPSTNKNFDIENIIPRGKILEKFEERFEKRSSIEKLGKNEPSSQNLIYSVCAASLTTFFILVVVITLYAVRNSRGNLEKHKSKTNANTVAVYTTSIFHSPLPDPPMFDNPTYLTTRANRNSWNQDKRESVEIQELDLVFEKPVTNTKLVSDTKQYFYDHPPSTGSYRASSEVDTFSHYNLSQKSTSGIVLEPVYDEIPSKPGSIKEECDVTNANVSDLDLQVRRNADSNCLYVNTCGRTKF